MAVVINSILCQEVVHGYEEGADIMSGLNCTKQYLCSWADRFKVMHGVLGLAASATVGGLITFNYPMPFPELAAASTNTLASFYARSLTIKGVGNPTQGANNVQWPYALITVTFGSFPWTFQGVDQFQINPANPYQMVEQHITFSGEFITVPGTQTLFASTSLTCAASNVNQWGFYMPQADINLTLKNIPYLPAQQILNALAAPVNSVPYLGCAAGYLMFRGGSDSRTQASDGTQTASLQLQFSYRPIAPWDYTFNGKRTYSATYGYWDQVLDLSGNPIIPRSDISTIIPSAYVA